MPARTNAFQQLIYAIERQLSGGARVVESLMLADRDGIVREVDVAIEATVGAHAVRIAVECRDHQRKADLVWIEQLHAKYREIPVSQVVAVARAGFSRSALRKAAAYNIRALTLREASGKDWAALTAVAEPYVIALTLTTVRYLVDGAALVEFSDGTAPITIPPPPVPDVTRFVYVDWPQGGTLEDVVNAIGGHEALRPYWDAVAGQPGGERLNLERITVVGVRVLGPDGVEREIAGLTVPVRRVRDEGTAPLNFATYGEVGVAYGSAQVGDVPFRVVRAASRGNGNTSKLQVIFDPPPGVSVEVLPDGAGVRFRQLRSAPP